MPYVENGRAARTSMPDVHEVCCLKILEDQPTDQMKVSPANNCPCLEEGPLS